LLGNGSSCTGSCPALLVTSGLAQDVGIALALSGLFVPETQTTVEKSVTSKATWRVVPTTFGRASAGIGAIGQF